METISSAILLILALVAFANYRNGTLGQWGRAKFFNSAVPNQRPPHSDTPADVPGGAQALDDTTLSGNRGAMGTWQNPTGGRCISPFGAYRAGPPVHTHEGVDLEAATGTAVHATRAGRVLRAGNAGGLCGLRVAIDHGGGWTSIYCHLSQVLTAAGRNVAPGAVIARSGDSGNARGHPHLHFEIRHNDKPINPAQLIGVSC